jgi:Trypsin-co-occurring domain 2
MTPNTKYLKDISRALAGINLLQKQKAEPVTPNKVGWLKISNLIALSLLVLWSSYRGLSSYKATNLHELIASKEEASYQNLDVSNLVRKVQDELTKSEQERRKNNIPTLFVVNTFELEIGFIVRKETNHGEKYSLEVATVDNQMQVGAERIHKIKLVFGIAPPYSGSASASDSQPPTDAQTLPTVTLKKGRNK